MWIEFDDELINLNWVKRIFVNGYSKEINNEYIFVHLVELHFNDVKPSDNYDDDLNNGYNSNIVVEYYDSFKEAEIRYSEIKKLLIKL